MPPKIATTLAQSNERKSASSPRKIRKESSGNVQDQRESNVTQILSQRLGNLEQQLFLLRGDLKDAVETLKKRDQEITTLENKIALAERRSEAEKNGLPSEDLHDPSEDVDPQSKSKQELLQKECETLARKLQDMEKFFGDYGLAWVKEDALDVKDPNNLWVRKTNVHYTPDFDKIFVVVEELNLGNAEPQIVKAGNTAQFKTADLLNLSLYADGIQLENNPFRPYESPSVEEFFRDLEDGYFPTELKGKHPEGVIFKVRDMRNTMYADDPNRRPVVRRGQNVTSSPGKMSTSSGSRGSERSFPGVDVKSESGKAPNTNAGGTQRLSRLISRKGSASSRRSIIKNIAKKSTNAPKPADGQMHPQDAANLATSGDGEKSKDIKLEPSAVGDVKASPGKARGNDGKPLTSPGGDGKALESSIGIDGPEGGVVAETDHSNTKEGEADVIKSDGGVGDNMKSREGVAESVKPIPGSDGSSKKVDADAASSDPKSTDADLKQLYVAGQSPQTSSTRVAQSTSNRTDKEQKVELDKELTKDSFGLPKPPLSISASDRLGDVQKPTGPPSKHFDNYFLNKTGETQTSGTYIIAPAPQGQPKPTHITNITYNEGPITIQMTPNELKGAERNTASSTALKICPVHHPQPCTCAHGTLSSDSPEKEDGIGPVNLIKITGETEYREKFTEGAMNTKNVWQQKKRSQEQEQKKRSQEQEQKKSHGGSATVSSSNPIAAQDVAPIPPDPVQMGAAVDPNVQWPNFVYFGHPKGQEASPPPPSPVSPPPMAKKKSESPQIIQLNEKTSERMIVVKMRTRSGHKEFNANVYPEEPVKKLWSLLKLNDKEYSLTSTRAPHKPLRRGSIGEHSVDNGLSLVLSKTKANSVPMVKVTVSSSSASDQESKSKSGPGVKTLHDEGIPKTPGSQETDKEASSRDGVHHTQNPKSTAKTEVASTSKEGSNVTNVNISINIDSHTSHVGSEQEKNIDTKKQQTPSREKQKATEENGRFSKVATNMSYQPLQEKDRASPFSMPITPKTRAKALSEHLSQSSLHKKSFQSMRYRNSPLKETLQKEPSLLEKEGGGSKGSQRTAVSKEFTRSSPVSSTGRLPDKDASAKNLLNKGVRSSKQSIQSFTKMSVPKTITRSQSLKLPSKKVPSKSPSVHTGFSESRLSIEKVKTINLTSVSSVESTDIKIVVHSPTPDSSGKESSIDQPRGSGKRSTTEQKRGSHSVGSVQGPKEKRSSMSSKRSCGSKQTLSPVPMDQEHVEVEITGRKSSNESMRGRLSSIDQPGVDGKRGDTAQRRSSHSARNVRSPKEKTSSIGSKGSFASKQTLSPIPSVKEKMVDQEHLEAEITGRKSSNESMRGKLSSTEPAVDGKTGDTAQRRSSHSARSVQSHKEKRSSMNSKRSFGSKQTLSPVPSGKKKMMDQDNVEVEITGKQISNVSVRGKLSTIDELGVDSKRGDTAPVKNAHSPRSVRGPHEKRSPLISKGSFSSRKSISPRREPAAFLERNEVDQSPGGTAAEKHGKSDFHGAGTPSHGQTSTADAERRSSAHEIVEPVNTEKRLSNPNVDGRSLQSGADPKNASETGIPQKINEDVVKGDVKAPNTDPPHISEVDLNDDKEAKISSVNQDPKFEYDKHDSEQEFKRETPTDTPTMNINVENKVHMQSVGKIDEREEKNINTSKKKTKTNKNKNQKSSENDDTKERGDSQERDNSDGNKNENAEVTSPAVSKEDIESDYTKGGNAEDTSEGSLV